MGFLGLCLLLLICQATAFLPGLPGIFAPQTGASSGSLSDVVKESIQVGKPDLFAKQKTVFEIFVKTSNLHSCSYNYRQGMFDRDVGRNYDQRSLYRKVTPNSRQISLHNRIFKVSFSHSPHCVPFSIIPRSCHHLLLPSLCCVPVLSPFLSSSSSCPSFTRLSPSLSDTHPPDCRCRRDQENELLKGPGF